VTGPPVLPCVACLRRTWLLRELAGAIEIARHDRQRLPDLLALGDAVLARALLGDRGADYVGRVRALDAEAMRGAYAAAGLVAVCRHDPRYPQSLRDDRAPPAVLGLRGRLELLHGGAIAVVGTRRCSVDGAEIARGLGRGLAVAGVTVVSGMALGIDSAAHEGALDAGGPTVAVLAGGADVPYPARKRTLHEAIGRDGLIVAELPPGTRPHRWMFPARNRLIAALAGATIVVEAAQRSGSLITAELALEAGRDVGAVPGPVLSWRSAGVNALLRDGAVVVRDARDAVELALGVDAAAVPTVARTVGLPGELRDLLVRVTGAHATVEALIGPGSAGDVAALDRVLTGLAELELRGLVRRAADGRWAPTAS
jgi:DNA processing protein